MAGTAAGATIETPPRGVPPLSIGARPQIMPKTQTRARTVSVPAVMAAAILAVAALLRLWLATRNAGLTMDSPLYVHMAESLARGSLREIGPAHHGWALVALAGLLLPGRSPGRVARCCAGWPWWHSCTWSAPGCARAGRGARRSRSLPSVRGPTRGRS